MPLKVEKNALETYEQMEAKREIAKLKKENQALFERVCELANKVSEFNLETYMTTKNLHEMVADLQS